MTLHHLPEVGFQAAARVSRIKVSPSTAAAARARELKAAGRNIVDMTVGEPDFDTPDPVKAEAVAAIERGETKYTAVNGTTALRQAITADFERRLRIRYADNAICVGGGAKQILFLALMASVEDGADDQGALEIGRAALAAARKAGNA